MVGEVVASLLRNRRRLAAKKNVYGYFLSQSNAHAQVNVPQTGSLPEQANCNEVVVMSQRGSGKRCVYRHTSSPGLTPTRRRSVGR